MRRTVHMDGKYIVSHGVAGKVTESEPRRTYLNAVFGSKVYGTFNVEVRGAAWRKAVSRIEPAKYGYWESKGVLLPVEFRLCELFSGEDSVMCWAVTWHGVANRRFTSVELYSRQLIPDKFKTGALRLSVYGSWDKLDVEAWVPTYKKWFQSFPFTPQRSNNELVWGKMFRGIEWSGKRVLDIGCNTGWYAFRANRYGASVDAFDPNLKTLKVAKTIGRHIIQSDVNFYKDDPGGDYDVIFYLSVHHQIDCEYDKLINTVGALKKRCKVLMAEFIDPAPHTSKRVPIKKKPVLSYQHEVRGLRSLYIL